MKLIYKLLLGYFLIISIIGTFSTFILMHTVNKSSTNLSVYREREITSFVQILNAIIIDEENLKNTEFIQSLFESSIDRLPHIKRLTLHTVNPKTAKYTHVVSTDRDIIGTPSHTEDIDAILQNKTTVLYETGSDGEHWIDITYPITNKHNKAIAALGAAVSLHESDEILKKSMQLLKNDALNNIFIGVILAILLSFIFVFVVIRKIVTPITKLTNATNAFSKGEFTHTIDISTNDEIGNLSTAFNKMTNELDMLHSSMEEQIQDKTEELKMQFLSDALTGLPNRQALFEEIKKNKEFHVAIIDIASFKDINDFYGVEIGNKVLQLVSKKVKMYLSDSHLKIYRLGADEIAILNLSILSEHKFKETLKQLINNLEHDSLYFREEDIEINISLHAGLSFESSQALEKANIALTNAKKEHVDLVVFNKKIDEESKQEENLNMIIKIKNAIKNYDFVPCYQVIVDKDRNIIKYEALVRMKNNKELIHPYSFLDIAKRTKYYKHITRTMIFQTFKEFEHKNISFSINIEAEDILNEDTKNFIKNHLEGFKDPERVVFEIVESENIHNIPEIKEFIGFIKKQGAKIAIDDFGTGYSNFTHLLKLEPDYIKIDGSLIKNIDTDSKSYNIVKTLVNFAHNLNIKVIAEFVHSNEVFDTCKELDVDEFQGYLFAKPSLKVKD
ncbi:EAL domain-containing protein [Sulfurovum sp. CS9]|uniref:EAL domain-containing protein n=1 Tax=Sulfurovum sp. CS9 TaxID=3391146 RepID=UPI0039EC754E